MVAGLACLLAVSGGAQKAAVSGDPQLLPTSQLLSGPGPTFTLDGKGLHKPVSVIMYGDMRFTDAANVVETNPIARQALVRRIAAETPDAVMLSGDVPLRGGVANNYVVFKKETEPWRAAGLRVYPALGNHEFLGCPNSQDCLDAWWDVFPELKGRRWYSVLLGKEIYLMAVDSDAPLTAGSDQAKWIQQQLAGLPKGVRYVLIAMHHPPMADPLPGSDHNPRVNEQALLPLLRDAAKAGRAQIIVSAAHIHNYERFEQDGVTYLVSGGGGAKPLLVARTGADKYQGASFPNYHYVKFTLKKDRLECAMYRMVEPINAHSTWEARDTWVVLKK